MAKSPWNLNRLVLMLGAAAMLAALIVMNGGDLAATFSPSFAPFFVGVLAAVVLAFWARPWLYLVVGLLLAAFPLIVLFVFGAMKTLAHPASGAETQGVALLVLTGALGLTGGILGFVQGRKDAQPPVNAILRAPQGVFSVLLITLLLGALATSALATADARVAGELSASVVEGGRTVRVDIKKFLFEPETIEIPAGELVVLELVNHDPVGHTLTYVYDGQTRETTVPGRSTALVPMKIDTPQTIEMWCEPHKDTMRGTIAVV